MNRISLINQIKIKKTFLCVGLDTDINKIPTHLLRMENAVVKFNKALIDATKSYCVAYKLNTAFYEVHGSKGWQWLEETLAYIPETHFKIADAKRGDIGNTSAMYAKTFFKTYAFDAVTVAPYMGEDSLRPFLEYTDKFTIVLGLTSNKGAQDFEMLKTQSGNYVFEEVIAKICYWGTTENLMFVVGATQANDFYEIRKIIPDHFLLVPGIGEQGGDLKQVCQSGLNKDTGLLINASRTIIYNSAGEDFAEKAAAVAQDYQQVMTAFLS